METDLEFERALLRADIRSGNTEAAQAQHAKVVALEEEEARGASRASSPESPPSKERNPSSESDPTP